MAILSSRAMQILLSLTILTALLYYLISGTPALIGSQSSRLSTAADSYLIDGTSWQYNQAGDLNHRLQVASLHYFNNAALSRLEKPILQVYKHQQLAWTASALQGNISHRTQTIELIDSVTLNNDKKSIRLTTSAMTVTPASKIAESTQPTLIVDSQGQVEAQSMYADLGTNIVTLKKKVKGYYAAP